MTITSHTTRMDDPGSSSGGGYSRRGGSSASTGARAGAGMAAAVSQPIAEPDEFAAVIGADADARAEIEDASRSRNPADPLGSYPGITGIFVGVSELRASWGRHIH